MYSIVLTLHSWVRWLVLASLLFALFRAYNGWFSKREFSRFDQFVRRGTTTVVHIQLILGVWLYAISPIVNYFLHHFREAVHETVPRFFGMEHIVMMLAAIIVITIGSAKAKRGTADREKFKTMAIWFTIGLVMILTSIPWAFSPFAARPHLRFF